MIEWIQSASSVWLEWVLLHTLQTSLFVLVIWALDRALKPNAAFSYLLWLLALVKAFVPPLFPMPWPAPTYPATILSSSAVMEVPPAAIQPTPEPSFWSPATLLLVLWLAGVLSFALFLVVRNLAVRHALARAQFVGLSVGSVLPEYEAGRLGQIPLYEMGEIKAPMLIGLLRPRIILPESWREWQEERFRLILNHEVAHARRRDLWVSLLQLFMLSAFFFNPLVWLVHSRINRAREQACDESALRQTGFSAADYCKTLCAFVEPSPSRLDSAFAGLYFLESARTLKERVKYLLSEKEESAMLESPVRRLAMLAVLGLAMVGLSWQCSKKTGPGAPVAADAERVNKQATVSSSRQEGQITTKSLSSEQRAGVDFVAYDTAPEPIGGFQAIQSRLKYPEIARRAGIEGRVIVHVHVSETGEVLETRVLQSLGQAGCDEAAVEAVKSVRWKPALQKDQPVNVWVAIPVVFKLPGETGAAVDEKEASVPAPPPPSIQEKEAIFVAYDRPPEPVGGFAVIQQNLKYPEIARRAGIEGRVVLHLQIDESGQVIDTRVLRSLGEAGCDEAAIEAVKSVQWRPAEKDGRPVKVWIAIPVIFKLKSAGKAGLEPTTSPPPPPPAKPEKPGIFVPYPDPQTQSVRRLGLIKARWSMRSSVSPHLEPMWSSLARRWVPRRTPEESS